jgi:hypothetical protein
MQTFSPCLEPCPSGDAGESNQRTYNGGQQSGHFHTVALRRWLSTRQDLGRPGSVGTCGSGHCPPTSRPERASRSRPLAMVRSTYLRSPSVGSPPDTVRTDVDRSTDSLSASIASRYRFGLGGLGFAGAWLAGGNSLHLHRLHSPTHRVPGRMRMRPSAPHLLQVPGPDLGVLLLVNSAPI